MNDEIISKSNVGSNIPFADEDAINVDGGASRLVTSWITSRRLTNAEEDTCSRNVQNFTTFRASGLPAIARRDLPSNDGKMLNHRRELSQQHYARQSSAPKTDQSEEIEGAPSRFENAVIKYQQSKLRPKRQISRERQQQQSNYSSSDESVARNKSKSTSSIDTQSVNNILDEYEDLDYRRSSDLSDVGNISVTNFEAIMMDQQKRQQVKSKQIKSLSSTKIQTKSIPTRENIQPVLKVNQQTQVRQRSRDRQKDSNKGLQQDTCVSSPITLEATESGRSKMPEILLRKGEVQKRVDEWLNQAHSQNFPVTPREKPLTRSNSSAEQKSQRRYRGQDSRSSIDEARDRLNGGTSSSYDDLTHVNRRLERGRPEKMNINMNASRGTYKEYLVVRSKQQDYGFNAQLCAASSRSADSNLASRIPQRGLLSSSFKSRRVEADLEEKTTAASRIMNLAKAMSESDHGRTTVNSNSKMIEVSVDTTTTTSAIISCKRPSQKKRPGNGVDENCAVAAARSLVKEEMDPSCEPGSSKGLSLPGGSLSDQGESISPNKDGESRRSAATASGPTLRPVAADKTIEAACKSTEASTRCAANYPPRGSSSRIASSAESDRVITTESPRRRLQFCSDFRREPRSIDQSRQEQPTYGSAVSARVRALQGQVEPRTSKSRCHQVAGASMEVRRPPVLPRRDLGVSPSRDAGSQDRTKISIGIPSSSNFKSNNRAYTTISDSQQQPNEQNATRSKIAATENVPSVRVMRYASPDHVEKIYERSLQPQVIHTDNLESIFRPSLQASLYGEKVGVSKLDRESTVKETSSTFEEIGKSRHEHLETIEEDDRKSEGSVCRYPEIGLKQCLKVQKSLPNGRSKDSADKRKDNPIYVKWNQQQYNEPAKTFASFQSTSTCQNNVKSSIRSRSPEIKKSTGQEDTRQDPDESTTILQDLVGGYEDASREDQDQLTIHSRENSNLSTATIPVDELENQGGSRLKTEEDPSRNKLQFGEKSQDRVVEETMKNADERGAIVNEILVKNLQFEQDLPAENPVEQMRSDHVVQQVNFHNILCDNYENEKLKNKKMYMTNEEMEHRRLIDMLKRGNFETLKMVSKTL